MIEEKQWNYVDYGSKRIDFLLAYCDRKNLRIDVNPDMTVRVEAPHNATIDEIQKRVKKRAHWVMRQKRYFEQFHPLQPARKFVSGETHRYLGRQYRLKVIAGTEKSVKLTRGYIVVELPEVEDAVAVKKLVTQWYRHRAELIFKQELSSFMGVVSRLEVEMPLLQLRAMKLRWGSCTRKGSVVLNTELIKAGKSSIRYVILHELCHLKEYNHTPKFYELLDSFMPDWKKQRENLNRMADLMI